MPISQEKFDLKTLFYNQAAYERIDSVGKTSSAVGFVEFEKSLFGAG